MSIVSVAMATYNGARFLPEQLNSLAAQTRLPDELVVSDDASSDETAAIVEDFARTAPFSVRLQRNAQNLGFIRNFEQAAKLASGEFVFLCDQDDVWDATKVAAVLAQFAARPHAQVVINDARLADAELRTEGHTQLGNIGAAGGDERAFFTGCCSAHRRGWQALALPLPPSALAHDQWINGLAIELGCAVHLDTPLQTYRRHGANESQWLLSEPGGVSFWDVLRAGGLHDAREGWRARVTLLRGFVDRVRSRAALAAANGWDARLPAIEAEISAIERRIALCSMPRWQRGPQVARLWASGGYRSAAGWKSAVKDLVRP